MACACWSRRRSRSPEQDPKRRLDHVDVREHPDALIVTVWMREEATLGEDELCSGVGTSFAHRVRLPRAIGRGGVIDAGVSRGEPWELELKPDDGDAIRRLRRRFDLYCPWNSGCAS